MLKTIYIKNIAIIEELENSFESGLNIITGETGSGKTVLVQTIKYLLGERFPKDSIRTGTDRAVLEAVFEIDDHRTTVRRVFQRSGSSRSFIDDEPVNLDKLRQKVEYLADIHGQHDQQRLLDPGNHLEYLDAFGDYLPELETVKTLYHYVIQCKTALSNETKQQQSLLEKQELYQFQLQELEQMEYHIGLDTELETEYRLLTHAADIRQRLQQLLGVLDENENSLAGKLDESLRTLGPIAGFDNALTAFEQRLKAIQIDNVDLTQEIASFLSKVVVDDARLQEIEEKIQHLEMLKRKYGGSLEQVEEYHIRISKELNQLARSDKEILRLRNELDKGLQDYRIAAGKLTELRRSNADVFEKEVAGILKRLSMENTKFKVMFNQLLESNYSDSGMELCEFFISPNIGEENRPLARIASGGELSRIMLALKVALQHKDPVDTLIFDEVDSGISGATAQQLGNVIQDLSEYHQVIVITHLPQIASYGNIHFKIQKKLDGARTFTKIDKLEFQDRVNEIATLISGRQITDSSLDQAKQLILETNG